MKKNNLKWELISDEEYDEGPLYIEEINIPTKKKKLSKTKKKNLVFIKYTSKFLKYLILCSLFILKRLF